MAAYPAGTEVAARRGHLHRTRTATVQALHEFRPKGPLHRVSVPVHCVSMLVNAVGRRPPSEGSPDRRRLYGRLGALFYAGSGAVGLATLPLPATSAAHLEVLEEGADDREVRAVKDMLVDELGLMGRLVEDLATLAWLDDRALLKVESLPLDSFVSSITAKAETILGDHVRVRYGLRGAMLRADPQRLTQAIVNLLQNVADHAKGDEPVWFRVLAEPSSWRFEVADDGGGLPPGDEQAVFEQFSTGSSRGGGTGLGLAIVRKIAKAHGGTSGVVNRPGEGATFWIRIPR